jgi:hypothetical protein
MWFNPFAHHVNDSVAMARDLLGVNLLKQKYLLPQQYISIVSVLRNTFYSMSSIATEFVGEF